MARLDETASIHSGRVATIDGEDGAIHETRGVGAEPGDRGRNFVALTQSVHGRMSVDNLVEDRVRTPPPGPTISDKVKPGATTLQRRR